MLTYRQFRNTDPPAIVAVWRRCAEQLGLHHTVSPDLLEELVLGKLYFDPAGLLLAFDGPQPVGVVHAGFGPEQSGDRLDRKLGVVCLLLVVPEYQNGTVADRLLQLSEQYLQRCGAVRVELGGLRPLDPFYLGLIPGSEVPGISPQAQWLVEALHARDYQQTDHTWRYKLPLAGFQPPIDYRQIQLRRKLRLDCRQEPPARTWWEACVLDVFERARFRVTRREGGPAIAVADCWMMHPVLEWPAGRVAGLVDLRVAPEHRRKGVGSFLVFEAARHLSREGVVVLEMLARESSPGSDRFCTRLGMDPVGEGLVFSKKLPGR